jgi:hypothetical protein
MDKIKWKLTCYRRRVCMTLAIWFVNLSAHHKYDLKDELFGLREYKSLHMSDRHKYRLKLVKEKRQ